MNLPQAKLAHTCRLALRGYLLMNLLVTGGCGFIGSNFIRQRLTEGDPLLQKLVNLDKLTYAGNPANLADLAGDPRYVFVQGDIGDPALVARLLAEHAIDAVVNFAAESHVDRSIDSPEPFIQTNVVGTLRLLNCARLHWSRAAGSAKRRLPLPPRLDGRGLWHAGARGPAVARGLPLPAQFALRGLEGGQRSSRPRLPSHLWAAGPHDQLLQQLRALSLSRKRSSPW